MDGDFTLKIYPRKKTTSKSPFKLFNWSPELRFHGGTGFLDANAFKQMHYWSTEETKPVSTSRHKDKNYY